MSAFEIIVSVWLIVLTGSSILIATTLNAKISELERTRYEIRKDLRKMIQIETADTQTSVASVQSTMQAHQHMYMYIKRDADMANNKTALLGDIVVDLQKQIDELKANK